MRNFGSNQSHEIMKKPCKTKWFDLVWAGFSGHLVFLHTPNPSQT